MMASEFRRAKPFPHVVIDNFIDAGAVQRINEEWPEGPWKSFTHSHSNKRACATLSALGDATGLLVGFLNCADYVRHLETLTGIPGLSADPSLAGGGLHETLPGGFLDIHADFNIHPVSRLTRRLNLLLFLNVDWREEWNGHLELWGGGQVCYSRIAPIAGRCVIFETTNASFHGHPDPLACPEGRSRRSLALYYYSPGDSASVEHSTLYLGDEAKWPAGVR